MTINISRLKTLGAEYIASMSDAEHSLEHKGVKGMKWGKRKAVDPETLDSTAVINKFGETAKEAADRKKMVDEYLKTAGKGTSAKTGKGGGKSKSKGKGGGKGKSKKKASKGKTTTKEAKIQTTTETSTASNPITKYPVRYRTSPTTTPSFSGMPVSEGAKAIIEDIKAKVAARKASSTTTEVSHNTTKKGAVLVMTDMSDEIKHKMSLGSDFLASFMYTEKSLEHHGVLGMKWGVRNDNRSSGRPQGGASRKKAPLSTIKKTLTKKSSSENTDTSKSNSHEVRKAIAKSMTDEELRTAINRMQMEKTYAQLLADNNPTPKKRESVVKKVVADSIKAASGRILTDTATKVGTYVIASIVSTKYPELGKAILPQQGDKKDKTKTDGTSTN